MKAGKSEMKKKANPATKAFNRESYIEEPETVIPD